MIKDMIFINRYYLMLANMILFYEYLVWVFRYKDILMKDICEEITMSAIQKNGEQTMQNQRLI